MDSKVIVLTPNGRRQTVYVSANTTILQILEEVCRKHEFDSDSYCLKHHNREVGLTQIFRFSGLPNNCLLEMAESSKKRVAEKVDVCIQLEDGTRQLDRFESSENIWSVIQKLCAEAVSTIENPVILYMRQEICGKDDLVKATLKSLGIFEGRALLRLVDKKPEELKTQANVYKAPVEKQKDEDEVGGSTSLKSLRNVGGGGGFSITKDLVKSLKTETNIVVATASTNNNESNRKDDKDEGKENKPQYDWGTGKGHTMQATNQSDEQQNNVNAEMEIQPEFTIIGERKAILFSLDVGIRKIEDLPDSFYDLTVNDLKLVLRDLKRISTGTQDTPLMTQKLRELERQKTMLNKIAQYKNCIIRVQLPGGYVLQGVFKPSDVVLDIVSFVRTFLRNQNDAFTLFTIPPKTVLPLDKNLLELDLVPTAVLHFAWEGEPADPEDHTNVLNPEYLSRLTSIEGAIYAANKFRIINRSRNNSRGEDEELPGPSTGAISKRSKSDN